MSASGTGRVSHAALQLSEWAEALRNKSSRFTKGKLAGESLESTEVVLAAELPSQSST
eukprot:CAMPEP_0197450166 /NCGR_PEP_ID=MMETSP1175-20131217/24218_1 /TAXON_ID=1003142 /ORGANISM="Triceratium dubium, Strain CCMP147" /LENGTH=57 /DNA_ID=CAMNT_0042982525 /DNA_START=3 /DNA_END=172 /DNA_ORIENTATION=+